MREAVEQDSYEQSILNKRMARKRKLPMEEEVRYML